MARIAIVADTTLQRSMLQQALLANGYESALSVGPAQLDLPMARESGIDLWLVDLALADDGALLEQLVDEGSPILFGEGQAPERHSEGYWIWERRLLGKLRRLLGDPASAVGPALGDLGLGERPPRLPLPEALAASPLRAGEEAEEVWLLLAGTGGPVAVKRFLDVLPGGLPLSFLYAQHLEPGYEASLATGLASQSQWRVGIAQDGDVLRCGEVAVVPVDRALGFAADGRMALASSGWPEPYSPSFDQLMLAVAQRYGARCGIIVFSGAGNDGSGAAAYVRRQGVPIWTQRPAVSGHWAMGERLRENGHSVFTGDPDQLAADLLDLLATKLGSHS